MHDLTHVKTPELQKLRAKIVLDMTQVIEAWNDSSIMNNAIQALAEADDIQAAFTELTDENDTAARMLLKGAVQTFEGLRNIVQLDGELKARASRN